MLGRTEFLVVVAVSAALAASGCTSREPIRVRSAKQVAVSIESSFPGEVVRRQATRSGLLLDIAANPRSTDVEIDTPPGYSKGPLPGAVNYFGPDPLQDTKYCVVTIWHSGKEAVAYVDIACGMTGAAAGASDE
jgi:hypothetical protein